MAEILAIGAYKGWNKDALAEMGATFFDRPEAVADLDEETRGQVRALAYAGHHPLRAETLDRLPALGIVANYGVGYDAIDVAAAEARGIRVTNTPDVLDDDVADLAVGMLLAQARGLVPGDAWVRSGRWGQEGPMPLQRSLTGMRVGICGLGRIGREIADRLAALKTKIHYYSRSEKQTPGWPYHADPVDLARTVDVLVVSVVGGASTEGLVDREMLGALGPEGIVINISRGSVIDEGALLDMLEAGEIGGAGLDVFRGEPDPDPRFAALPQVVLQPHQGSATTSTRGEMGRLQRDNIAAFLRGEALLTPVV